MAGEKKGRRAVENVAMPLEKTEKNAETKGPQKLGNMVR